MTKASFRFSTKILARLGEELNQSADQSINELVKNAYDADATNCTIKLTEVGKTGGSITIEDDGNGMNSKIIRDNWLVLGHSGKNTDTVTALGRKPAGSKGLGRLAALRMGTGVILESVHIENPKTIHSLTIDWHQFDDSKVVEDVPLTINLAPNSQKKKGTSIELSGLRSAVSSDELRRLARSLLLLTDPFGDKKSGFQIDLVAPEFKEIERLVKKKYFEDASYHLRAELDIEGNATAAVLDWQDQVLVTADLQTLRKSKKPAKYNAPAAIFDLWVFILTPGADAFSTRSSTKSEIQSWLSHFGGVHVYQDDIRVAPYGNAGNDWLEMNLARARSPEERPSTNTSIGRVQIAGGGKHALQQKTDRSGFIENQSFEELKTFAQDALTWLARWRLTLAEKRREKERTQTSSVVSAQKARVEDAIALAPPEARKAIEEAFSGYDKSRNKEAETLRKEIQLYRTLSTAGITAAIFSHESDGNPLKIIQINTNALRSRISRLVDTSQKSKLIEPVENIQNASYFLSTLGNATLSLVKANKRKVSKVYVNQTIEKLVELFAPFIEGRSTEAVLDLEPIKPFLRTSEAALESIFANLINNALRAFERAGTDDRKISIESKVLDKHISIFVSDSGPGIKDFKLSEIWLPGVTGDPEGTGLGLTIVRDTIRDMGGNITVKPHGKLGGAEFELTLPILGID